MPLYPNVDVVIAYGYWLDEATRAGVAVDNRTPATVTLAPVDHDGTTTTTPNLRDPAAHGWLKTRTRTARVDPATGYFAAVLVATNDPDLDAYPGRQVTFTGEKPFTVQVPYNAPTVSATTEMVTALAGAVPGLAAGQQVKAMPLVDAAITSPAPTPAVAYLTATQTLTTIAAALDVHDTDPDAHADIRALIGQGGGGSGTTDPDLATIAALDSTQSGVIASDGSGWFRKTYTQLKTALGLASVATSGAYSDLTGKPTTLPPSGGAGGVLSGTYPNPGFAVDMATQAEADAGDTATAAAAAADASSKVAAHTSATDPHGDRAAAASALAGHAGNTANPHAVTKAQVGLGNADNTSDTNKPVSTAVQAALDALTAGVPEQARDALGAALVAGAGVTIVPDDGADTITISSTAPSGTTVPTRLTSSNTPAVPGELLIVNAAGGQRTITPPSSPALGTFVTVLKSDATANYVVWDGPTNSDTSAGLVRQWAGATFTWTGTVWAVTSANLTSAGGAAQLTQRSPAATSATTAVDNEIVPLDTSGGTFTLTGPSSGAPFGARWKTGTVAPTVAAPSGYTIAGAASISMGLAPGGSSGELVVWQAFGTDYQPVSGFKPQTALAAVFDSKGSAAAAQAAAATDATSKANAAQTASQPVSTSLTAIAALTPADDALLQRKAGAWTSRTPAQVKTDLAVGSTNLAFGVSTQGVLTTGTLDTAFGQNAQAALTTGSGNTAVGREAQAALTTGSDNTAVGMRALATVVGGQNNTAVGRQALESVTSGNANVAIGKTSVTALTSGEYNVGIGLEALNGLSTGSRNTAMGTSAGSSLTVGVDNTFVGISAGRSVISSSSNVAIGSSAGFGGSTPSNVVGTVILGANAQAAQSYVAVIGSSATGDRVSLCLGNNGAAAALGSGRGVFALTDAHTVPTANPIGGGVLYSEGGALKWRGSGGTITTIGPA